MLPKLSGDPRRGNDELTGGPFDARVAEPLAASLVTPQETQIRELRVSALREQRQIMTALPQAAAATSTLRKRTSEK